MDIVVNEIVNNDIEKMKYINCLIPKNETHIKNGVHSGKKKIKFKIIRPKKELTVKIDKFRKRDIEQMIELGEIKAIRSEWNH